MIEWSRREPPLPAVAVAGTQSLREATRTRLAGGAMLRAAISDDWIMVLGDDLPWAEGAIYLGREEDLLVPTTLRPSLPVGILRAALGPDTLAILPGHILTGTMPVRRAELT